MKKQSLQALIILRLRPMRSDAGTRRIEGVCRLAAIASVALALSACGLRGDLERPMPLWGDPPRIDADDPRTVRENEARAAAEKARLDAEREAARQAEIEELRRAAEGAPPPQ